jgi:hypothetical protein
MIVLAFAMTLLHDGRQRLLGRRRDRRRRRAAVCACFVVATWIGRGTGVDPLLTFKIGRMTDGKREEAVFGSRRRLRLDR